MALLLLLHMLKPAFQSVTHSEALTLHSRLLIIKMHQVPKQHMHHMLHDSWHSSNLQARPAGCSERPPEMAAVAAPHFAAIRSSAIDQIVAILRSIPPVSTNWAHQRKQTYGREAASTLLPCMHS
jgi:hypothetical protein